MPEAARNCDTVGPPPLSKGSRASPCTVPFDCAYYEKKLKSSIIDHIALVIPYIAIYRPIGTTTDSYNKCVQILL
jgi:hypothetical protein